MKTTLVAPLIAICFSISAGTLALGKDAAVTPAPTPKAAQTLSIIAANLCYGSQNADVTERIKELLRAGESFSANPGSLGADPHPYSRKMLVIFCEIDGKPAVFTAGEDEDVSRALLLKKAKSPEITSDAKVDSPRLEKPISERDTLLTAAKDLFVKVNLSTNDQGGPVIQTVRLNDKVVVEFDGRRYSGFRFVVDRAEAAEKQKVANKETMDFFWFFVPPKKMRHWYIAPVQGGMRGFDSFMPLKLSSFKDTEKFVPAERDRIILQQLAADRLEEGKEYVMWFSWDSEDEAPEDMSLAAGYKFDGRNFNRWQDITTVAKFLGLTPSGKKLDVKDRFQH